jgi:hypothetical protein
MRYVLLVGLLVAVSSLGADEYMFEWKHDDAALIDYFIFYRAHPDSLGNFARIDTTDQYTTTVNILPASIVAVTAVDSMGRESPFSARLDLTQLPPVPRNLRAIIRFEMEVQ